VRKNPDQVGFAANPKTSAYSPVSPATGDSQKEFDATIDSARARLYAASIMLLIRRNPHDFRNGL
jgi:hypothetical protein